MSNETTPTKTKSNIEKIARECYERYANSYAKTNGWRTSLPAWNVLDKVIASCWREALAPLANLPDEVMSLRERQAGEDNAVHKLNLLDSAVLQVQRTLSDAAAVTNLPPSLALGLEKLQKVLTLMKQFQFPLNWFNGSIRDTTAVYRHKVTREVLEGALRCHAAAIPPGEMIRMRAAVEFLEKAASDVKHLSDSQIEVVLEAFRDAIRVTQGAILMRQGDVAEVQADTHHAPTYDLAGGKAS